MATLRRQLEALRYCPPNVTIEDLWVDGAISTCFLDTVTTSVFGLFILFFGVGQLVVYRKYATRLLSPQVPKSRLYNFQVTVHFLLTILGLLELILRHTNIFGGQDGQISSIYGYQVVYLVFQTLTWPVCLAVVLVERHFQLPTPPSRGHGFVVLLTWSGTFMTENLALLSLNKKEWWLDLTTLNHQLEFGFWVSRYLLTLAAFSLGLKAPGISAARDYALHYDHYEDDEELNRHSASDGSTWRGIWRKLRTLFPYMWPSGHALQLRVVVAVICLLGVRIVNVFVPLYYKKIVDSFADSLIALGASSALSTSHLFFPWRLILIYMGLKFLQGGGNGGQGLLNNIRSFAWIPVQQYTTREIQVGLFSHLHDLSLRWHLSRKTGEVLRVMDRGTSSINSLLSMLVFNIIPTLLDMIVAIVYFASQFNVWFGIIVFATMAIYLGMTILCTEWRTKYRRNMNLADNDQRTKGVDSLINFETVKYYGAEDYEIKRYQKSILTYQDQEWKSVASLYLLNMVQNVILTAGLLTGSLYCGYLVSRRTFTVGDYILYGTYMLQLMVPLNWLGTLYRTIQESFVNMENMLDLLAEEKEVKDSPGALPIESVKGRIEFRDVSFHYTPERPILKNISFRVDEGETVAIVGPTGSGKSTIVRLLFRFYDVQSGSIMIDDQDVRSVTQESLRSIIGVVPQDTVLFNDTVSYNIHYGRSTSDYTEVEKAAKKADIHDKILSFPQRYETMVGERGLKLSGGEKQRIAIARTLLKSPLIVLLDEATSSLDTQTEKVIQNSFNDMLKGRTSIVIAHRLSTVVNADKILVLKDGEIVEMGNHEELFAARGLYYDMWADQANHDKDADKEET